jgi:hypothetical protein
MSDLAVPSLPVTVLVNVETGEALEPTVANAAQVLQAARTMKQRISDVIAAATDYLASESAVQGTKTLHAGQTTVTLTGGASVEYDVMDLQALLMEAGCPPERLEEAVVAEVTYRIDRSVLRQLAAANPNYAAAIELASRTVQKPYRASIR